MNGFKRALNRAALLALRAAGPGLVEEATEVVKEAAGRRVRGRARVAAEAGIDSAAAIAQALLKRDRELSLSEEAILAQVLAQLPPARFSAVERALAQAQQLRRR